MSMTPEKLKSLFLDLGKPTLRGVRKCPKCGTLNGTRGISCKNKTCDVVFKEREKKKGHSSDAVKVLTGSTVQVVSVRLRDRGPDYRGFVQLPLVQDLDGNPAENVDPSLLAQAARCYVESCNQRQQQTCSHIRTAIGCGEEATPLTLKNSVLNSLAVSTDVKQAIWLLATETTGPLVQRVTKNIMVVKCKPSTKHPLGFLHFAFFETMRNRQQQEYKFQCSCKAFKAVKAPGMKEEPSRRCVHYFACICAFASDEKLAMEFSYYIDPVGGPPVFLVKELDVKAIDSDPEEIDDDIHSADVDDVAIATSISTETVDTIASSAADFDAAAAASVPDENMEVMIIDDETLLAATVAKRMRGNDDVKTVVTEAVENSTEADTIVAVPALPNDTQAIEAQASSALLTLQDTAVMPYVVTPKKQPPSKPPAPRPLPAIKKPASGPIDEKSVSLTFHQWLASITERINQAMHYQFDGAPDPLVFHAPQKFFECVQQRISSGNRKRRLPNFTTGFVRKDALPLGTFTKYTWHITNVLHVKQIFDTPEMALDITRSFVENRDGTFDVYEPPPPQQQAGSEPANNKTPIRPFELKTYLKVGNTSPDQREPTPFIIEWIPDILPQLHIGELRIKFEYGHQRNGHIERRSTTDQTSRPASETK